MTSFFATPILWKTSLPCLPDVNVEVLIDKLILTCHYYFCSSFDHFLISQPPIFLTSVLHQQLVYNIQLHSKLSTSVDSIFTPSDLHSHALLQIPYSPLSGLASSPRSCKANPNTVSPVRALVWASGASLTQTDLILAIPPPHLISSVLPYLSPAQMLLPKPCRLGEICLKYRFHRASNSVHEASIFHLSNTWKKNLKCLSPMPRKWYNWPTFGPGQIWLLKFP